jgi:hypothetical protein
MQPLKGLTVVTLEHAIAAPFATRQLADLGARVIKIERPGSVDFARAYDSRVRGLASHFVWTNRSKESLTLDVKHPEAAKVLERLVIEMADVVVQNLRVLHMQTPADTCITGSVTHEGELVRLQQRVSRLPLQPRSLSAFAELAAHGGFSLARSIERPLSYDVLLSKQR